MKNRLVKHFIVVYKKRGLDEEVEGELVWIRDKLNINEDESRKEEITIEKLWPLAGTETVEVIVRKYKCLKLRYTSRKQPKNLWGNLQVQERWSL